MSNESHPVEIVGTANEGVVEYWLWCKLVLGSERESWSCLRAAFMQRSRDD